MKMNFFLSVVFVSLFLLSFSVGANVKLDSKNFIYPYIPNYVKTLDGVENGMLSDNAIAATKSIDCLGLEICDFTGINSLNGIMLYSCRNTSIPVLVAGASVVNVDGTIKKVLIN